MRKITLSFLTVFVLTVIVVSVVAADNFKPFPAPLSGKKIAVFLDNHYSPSEAIYGPMRLEEAGADIKIVSHHKEVFRFAHTIKTDISPKEALKTKWDGIYLVGGFSPIEIREDPDCIDIIKDVNNRNGLVSAICKGPCALVTADIIRGKNVTGSHYRHNELTNAGGIYHDDAPQIDGNIITAINPSNHGPFLDAIINWFDGGEKAAKAHKNDQYLKGKKVAMVIDNRFIASQIEYPVTRLSNNGAVVVLVSDTKGEFGDYRQTGATFKSDLGVLEAMNEKFDAVILIGHWAADTYRRHENVRKFIAKNLKAGTLIASINWGHTALIDADVCKGYEFACTWGMQNDIRNAGGKPFLEPAHRDRNLITCASDNDVPELMRYVVGYLTTMK